MTGRRSIQSRQKMFGTLPGILSPSDFVTRFPYADPSMIPPRPDWKEAARRAMWAIDVQRKMKELHTMPKAGRIRRIASGNANQPDFDPISQRQT